MTEIDLDALAALYANEPQSGTEWLDKATLSALIDRIETMEAELSRCESTKGDVLKSAAYWRARADRVEARLARVTDDSAVEVGAKAAYERAFLKHAPEDVDRWDDLVADNDPAAESWREVARAVIRAVAADEQEAGR